MLELKPAKPLKGELRFPGDRLQGQFLCALALVTQGVSRLGNWTRTQEWEPILAFLEKNGAAVTAGSNELAIAALPGLRERTDWTLDAELPQPFALAFLSLLAGLSTASRPVRVTIPPALRMRLSPVLDALKQGGFDHRDESESESVLAFVGQRPLRKKPSAVGLRRTVWTLAVTVSSLPLEFEEIGASHDLLENVLPLFGLGVTSLSEADAPDLDPEMAKRLQKRQKSQKSRNFRILPAGQIPSVDVNLQGDAQLASWAALCACLRRGSEVILKDVTHPSCRGAVFAGLRKMGADLEFVKKSEARGVPSVDIRVKTSQLLGRKFDATDLAGLSEAAPFLAMAATSAERETVLGGLGSLREGPVDVLDALAGNLRALGLPVGVFPEGLVLRGEDDLVAERLDAHEHEALALALHALASSTPGKSILENATCLERHWPGLAELEGRE
jgi:5-enolpyruvylshikimate-3-phosphate synthase